MSYRSQDTASFPRTRAIRANDVDTALLVKLEDRAQPIWFPQSTIHEDSEVWKPGDEGTLVVFQFIAEEKGLV